MQLIFPFLFSDKMDLDLSTVRNELHDVRTKWYDIGVELKLKIPTLKSIETRYNDDPKDCLREVITEWLKVVDHQTWKPLVDALRTRVIDEPKLAAELEAKYCSCSTESKRLAQSQVTTTKLIIVPHKLVLKLTFPYHVHFLQQQQNGKEELQKVAK